LKIFTQNSAPSGAVVKIERAIIAEKKGENSDNSAILLE